jgi:hypothetical protein
MLAGAVFAGCGGDGLSRSPVGGKVTYLGQPVASGAIVFEPTESVGMVAPTGSARIEDGQFQTAPDQSPIKGTYRVRVMGYDKAKLDKIKEKSAPGEAIEIPELFPEYRTEVEIPVPAGKLDIEVPERSRPGKR